MAGRPVPYEILNLYINDDKQVGWTDLNLTGVQIGTDKTKYVTR